MSDSIKSVIKNDIPVQISGFWMPCLEKRTFEGVQNGCFDKSKCYNLIPLAKLCIYVNFHLVVFILLEMENSGPLFEPQGLENDVGMGNCSGYKAIKTIVRSIKNSYRLCKRFWF